MNFNISKSYIFIHDIHIHAFHGVLEQEKKVGNDFRIDIKLGYDISKACSTDNIKDTLSYADVYQIIKEEMEIPSQLIEHVSARIVNHLFDTLPAISDIYILLAKRNPPLSGDLKEAGVEMNCSRSDLLPMKSTKFSSPKEKVLH